MIKLNTAAWELMHDTVGVARAALKSAAPSPIGETLRLSRRPCTASHALAGGGALLRIKSLFAVALPHLVEKGGGESWRWVFKPKPCAPCRKGGSGRQKEHAMRRYKSDPRWIIVRFKGRTCMRCKSPIHPGARTFFYPEDRSLYCGGDDCGKAASQEFSACSFDEENTTSM